MARRSVLFTPGDRPEMLRKAPGSGADVVVFDLEDAVAPARKQAAREAVRDCLADPEFLASIGRDSSDRSEETSESTDASGPADPGDVEVCVRVNGPELADDDLSTVLSASTPLPDSVMLPKVDRAGDVETLARLLAEHDRRLPVLALVETARGVLNAVEVADHPRTDALVFGAEDLAADLGATRTPEGEEVLYARQRVATAAAAAGVDAIDTVYTDLDDRAGLRRAADRAREFGYDGKMAVHPAQVDPINEAYTPTEDRVDWASRVLAARDEADAEGRGVFRVDDEMVDAPLIAQAERVIERARAAGIDVDADMDGEADSTDDPGS